MLRSRMLPRLATMSANALREATSTSRMYLDFVIRRLGLTCRVYPDHRLVQLCQRAIFRHRRPVLFSCPSWPPLGRRQETSYLEL